MASLVVKSYSHVWQGTAFAILAILFNISLMNTDQAQKNGERKSRSDTIRTNSNFEALQVTTHIPSGSPHSCLKVRIKGRKNMTTFQTRQGTGTGRERPGEKVSRAEIFPAITFFLKIRSIICQIEEVGEGVKLFLKMEFLTDRIFALF